MGTRVGASSHSQSMIWMKNMRIIPIRARNVDAIVVAFLIPGWACCHTLNASICDRPMSATQLNVASWSSTNIAKIRRSLSARLTVLGRNDTVIWSR